jgi:hypothetical protein
VAFANKPGVPLYGPLLPDPAIFEIGEDFRRFLLTKGNLMFTFFLIDSIERGTRSSWCS